MRDEAKTWWLVSGSDVASSYFFLKRIRVALESRDSQWYRQPLLTLQQRTPFCSIKHVWRTGFSSGSKLFGANSTNYRCYVFTAEYHKPVRAVSSREKVEKVIKTQQDIVCRDKKHRQASKNKQTNKQTNKTKQNNKTNTNTKNQNQNQNQKQNKQNKTTTKTKKKKRSGGTVAFLHV